MLPWLIPLSILSCEIRWAFVGGVLLKEIRRLSILSCEIRKHLIRDSSIWTSSSFQFSLARSVARKDHLFQCARHTFNSLLRDQIPQGSHAQRYSRPLSILSCEISGRLLWPVSKSRMTFQFSLARSAAPPWLSSCRLAPLFQFSLARSDKAFAVALQINI